MSKKTNKIKDQGEGKEFKILPKEGVVCDRISNFKSLDGVNYILGVSNASGYVAYSCELGMLKKIPEVVEAYSEKTLSFAMLPNRSICKISSGQQLSIYDRKKKVLWLNRKESKANHLVLQNQNGKF